MRVLSLHKEQWPLHTPFRITGHEWTDLDVIVVEIGQDGLTGRGEAAGVFYQGETVESMYAQIRSAWQDIERCSDREELRDLLPPGGARNAVDCAMWDLEAEASGRDVWTLADIAYRPVRTVMTISIRDSAKEMGEQARRLAAYPLLKVKLDSNEPVARLAAIRAARPDAEIVVDANQGFSFELLGECLPEFERLGIAMVEQPLPRGADECLEGFESPVPLCADESCLHLAELEQVAGRYQMINIKLDKCGGLTEGLALAVAAKAKGLDLMVGNMLGTSLAMAPGMVVAQQCRFVDLDGPLHLQCDRPPRLSFDRGRVAIPATPLWGGAGGNTRHDG